MRLPAPKHDCKCGSRPTRNNGQMDPLHIRPAQGRHHVLHPRTGEPPAADPEHDCNCGPRPALNNGQWIRCIRPAQGRHHELHPRTGELPAAANASSIPAGGQSTNCKLWTTNGACGCVHAHAVLQAMLGGPVTLLAKASLARSNTCSIELLRAHDFVRPPIMHMPFQHATGRASARPAALSARPIGGSEARGLLGSGTVRTS
jgi:hypothetical protein